ncbi:hypothetical protein ACFE04_025042 [Oxalis oulophora]
MFQAHLMPKPKLPFEECDFSRAVGLLSGIDKFLWHLNSAVNKMLLDFGKNSERDLKSGSWTVTGTLLASSLRINGNISIQLKPYKKEIKMVTTNKEDNQNLTTTVVSNMFLVENEVQPRLLQHWEMTKVRVAITSLWLSLRSCHIESADQVYDLPSVGKPRKDNASEHFIFLRLCLEAL